MGSNALFLLKRRRYFALYFKISAIVINRLFSGQQQWTRIGLSGPEEPTFNTQIE